MKHTRCFFPVLFALFSLSPAKTPAQSFEVQQLILDVSKLAELKNILNDLYKSYQILDVGYTAIRDISQGNFNLHKAFLDALLLVSPAVQNDHRVADIVSYQAQILSGYKTAFNRFKQDPHFTVSEIAYLGSVYNTLIDRSAKNLENLINVLTAGTLRMSDDERLHAIDGIYADTREQASFLQSFNNNAALLSTQRAAEQNDAQTLRQLYGLDY